MKKVFFMVVECQIGILKMDKDAENNQRLDEILTDGKDQLESFGRTKKPLPHGKPPYRNAENCRTSTDFHTGQPQLNYNHLERVRNENAAMMHYMFPPNYEK